MLIFETDCVDDFLEGVWLWHCHLDRHFTWGMATVFIVKDGGTPETSLLPPPDYMPPCTTPSPIRLEDFNDADGVVNTISKIWSKYTISIPSHIY